MNIENYRTFSEGTLKVYGNSVKIEEHFNSLTRDQIRCWIDKETESIGSLDEQFEEKFQNHVITHGIDDFENQPLWFNGTKYYPQNQPLDDDRTEPPTRYRGDIKCYSRSSRRRLLQMLNRRNPDNNGNSFHITLTYPKCFPQDGETHKKDLDAFIKRCKRRFSEDIAYLWKLEFQKRGAPHYHIILYLPKTYKIEFLRHWFSQNWYEVAQRYWETKLDNHINAGTSVDRIYSLRKTGSYLSKYIAKDEGETPDNQGRYWGCSRNWAEVMLNRVQLTGNQLIHFRRLVKRFLKGNKRMQKLATKPINLTVFGHWSFFTMAIEWVKEVH